MVFRLRQGWIPGSLGHDGAVSMSGSLSREFLSPG